MNCKECGSELLEGDCICGICGAEVTVFLQNPVTESATPAFDEPEYKSIYPTYEEAERIRRQRRQEAPDISLNSFSKQRCIILFRKNDHSNFRGSDRVLL